MEFQLVQVQLVYSLLRMEVGMINCSLAQLVNLRSSLA